MSRFSDLLNSPLPSKALSGDFFEGSDDFEKDFEKDTSSDDVSTDSIEKEGCGCGDSEECGSNCGPNCDEHGDTDVLAGVDEDDDEIGDISMDVLDGDEDDIDNMSDAELAALDAELSDEHVGAIADDGESEVSLSADEEQEANDMMSVAATTALINDEMNKEEKCKFIESTEWVSAAVNEGLLLESDVNELATTLGLITEANNYNKKMVIRLDKEAKKKQLFAIAVNVSAAAHHDADYVKLKKVNRMRKILRHKLIKKYQAEATRRMKVYFKKLTTSKATPLQKIGQALSRDK